MDKRIAFAVDRDLYAWLQRYAKAERRSIAETIRIALEALRADVGG